ncbi:molybdopterin-dependent oxidoreductase, partial [Mycobacterium sp.]|uniref:molybdopterin-dependent oxidoreductase n=1 Tax=Mycobacterium sp. TaxID=1785 RepID=UPI003C743F78
AGERGALEAGALPALLPGGRPLNDDTARAQVAAAWHVSELPSGSGRDAEGILAAAADGTLGALLVGGIEPDDFADPDAVLAALDAAGFVVSLELQHSAVTERADVVFPVAPTTQKSGAFVNWEGRYRRFEPALHGSTQQAGQSDHQVLDALADEMGVYLGVSSAEAAREELAALGAWDGRRAPGPDIATPEPPQPGAGEAVLTGWRMLLDNGRLQDGEPHLAGTARKPVLRLSADTAAEIGAADGGAVTVSTAGGSITLPLTITDMPDRVVWLPLNSPGSAVHKQLGVTLGSIVRIGVS